MESVGWNCGAKLFNKYIDTEFANRFFFSEAYDEAIIGSLNIK